MERFFVDTGARVLVQPMLCGALVGSGSTRQASLILSRSISALTASKASSGGDAVCRVTCVDHVAPRVGAHTRDGDWTSSGPDR